MKDYIAEAKEIIDKDKRELLLQTTKNSINGAIGGMVVGLMIGYYKQMNLYASGIIGMVAGGLLASMIDEKI